MTEAMTVKDIELAFRRIEPRVIESALVPPDTIYFLNDLELDVDHPHGWDAMTHIDKLKWAVDNGQTIMVRNLGK